MLKWVPVIVLVAAFFLFSPNYKKNEEIFFYELENGCLVYSLHMKMVLDANDRLQPYMWSRILAMQFTEKRLGHAILVFVYKNITFIYDPAQGSFVAAMYPLYDPQSLAEIAYPKLNIMKAAFLEPTLTLHYP